jgi:transglutaminase-like putative cysteine protease
LEGGRLRDENSRARWQWRRENLKAFEIEPGMYDFFNSSPRVAATSFKNFEEFGAAYWAETKKKAVVTPAVQALAEEITKDSTDPAAQASAIYEWVNKNIRYLSVILGKGGWIPHSTTEILANRYADCKDYATILHALLKAKGIESHPVLIRSELGNWFPDVAATDYFNHAVCIFRASTFSPTRPLRTPVWA